MSGFSFNPSASMVPMGHGTMIAQLGRRGEPASGQRSSSGIDQALRTIFGASRTPKLREVIRPDQLRTGGDPTDAVRLVLLARIHNAGFKQFVDAVAGRNLQNTGGMARSPTRPDFSMLFLKTAASHMQELKAVRTGPLGPSERAKARSDADQFIRKSAATLDLLKR